MEPPAESYLYPESYCPPTKNLVVLDVASIKALVRMSACPAVWDLIDAAEKRCQSFHFTIGGPITAKYGFGCVECGLPRLLP